MQAKRLVEALRRDYFFRMKDLNDIIESLWYQVMNLHCCMGPHCIRDKTTMHNLKDYSVFHECICHNEKKFSQIIKAIQLILPNLWTELQKETHL